MYISVMGGTKLIDLKDNPCYIATFIALAVMMGTNERLGADSFIHRLTPETLRRILLLAAVKEYAFYNAIDVHARSWNGNNVFNFIKSNFIMSECDPTHVRMITPGEVDEMKHTMTVYVSFNPELLHEQGHRTTKVKVSMSVQVEGACVKSDVFQSSITMYEQKRDQAMRSGTDFTMQGQKVSWKRDFYADSVNGCNYTIWTKVIPKIDGMTFFIAPYSYFIDVARPGDADYLKVLKKVSDASIY